MGRQRWKLTDLEVRKADKPGARLSDGGNLYLRISKTGVKSWTFMYSAGGKAGVRSRQTELGLGSYPDVTLAEARDKAEEKRRLRKAGVDPKASKLRDKLASDRTITFDEAVKDFIAVKKVGWKNAKHVEQWENTLATYASPVFGRYSVASIDTELVLKCLQPIWESKTETATRLRGRIEAILDWAVVKKYRVGENPARWKGHLAHILPAPKSFQDVVHHPALHYSKTAAFMVDLRTRKGLAARMMEFTILTAVRSGEARGARWGEFDFQKAVWTIPKDRMKMKREHRVPLSKDALDLVLAVKTNAGEIKDDGLVFPAPRKGTMFSDVTMLAVLKRMGMSDITVHGFRSTFRDWGSECTAYPKDVCEMALAHAIGNKVEEAYLRGDLFVKRSKLMDDWATYCNTLHENTDNVIPIQQGNISGG
jgi:integrase